MTILEVFIKICDRICISFTCFSEFVFSGFLGIKTCEEKMTEMERDVREARSAVLTWESAAHA